MTDIVNRDEEHLRLLSIFHYVVAGLTALFACIPIIHLIIGIVILAGGLDGPFEEHRGYDGPCDYEAVTPPKAAPVEPQTSGDPEPVAPGPPAEAAPEQFGTDGVSESCEPAPPTRRHRGGPPFPKTFFGVIFVVFPALFILCGWTLAVLLAVAGRCLARRKGYTFCLVVAGISCLFMPFGTILGVFTIVVLTRPSVKRLFNGGPAPDVVPPPIPPVAA
jgi:hypothetical protein